MTSALNASVLTIASGRVDHLRNVMLGLDRQTVPPRELVIARMQDAPFDDLPEVSFPVIEIAIDGAGMPLAAARNAAARNASGDVLIFLDVDCIPAPGLVEDYLRESGQFPGLLMGEVMYLPGGANAPGWQASDFEKVAVRHSDRQGPPASGTEICTDYRCFWSLNFAIGTKAFKASGGFDERYIGYGGEDTDFGKTLSTQGIGMAWMKGARVYHQYHEHHMPPVHHLTSVVRNAELFASKWGYRTMEHWLYAFKLMGLIDTVGSEIRILRQPDAADAAFTRQTADKPYANTTRVIRALQERLAKGNETPVDTLAAQQALRGPVSISAK